MPELNLNIPPDVKPIYAGEVLVQTPIKYKKSKKGRVEKFGFLKLIFYDPITNTVLANILIDSLAADALGDLLKKSANMLKNELKSDKSPKKIIEAPKKTDSGEYIG